MGNRLSLQQIESKEYILLSGQNYKNMGGSRSRGIRDWEEKRKALPLLFGVFSDKELARTILVGTDVAGNSSSAEEDQIEALTGSLKSWYRHNPTGATGRRFIQSLTTRFQEMGCTGNIHSVFVNGTYSDFYNILPEARRGGLARPYNPERQATEGDTFYPILVSRNAVPETARTGFIRGRIDQKLYYLSPEAVEIWKGVIDAGRYHQYDECKRALYDLTAQSDVWRDVFKGELADGAIMLGGGAPPKDLIVIRSMLELAPEHSMVNYALVDFSHYMLRSTFGLIGAALINEKHSTRVNLTLIEWDFLDLNGIGAKLRRPGKNVVWLIPGGTIGNLNERDFFVSVARQAKQGDLLVIGAETITSSEDEVSELTAKYNIPEVQKFVETPLRSVWHDMKLDGNIQDALDLLDVRAVDGVHNHHSSVTGAVTVEISLTVDTRKVILLTSTRYDEEKFIAFAAQTGFKHEDSVPSPLNERYKQLVFRYVTS